MTHPACDNGPLPSHLAASMIPVIKKNAFRLARRVPPHVCLDDLMSAGFLGLLTAHRRFDPTRGGDFQFYAEACIRGAMRDELRSCDPLSRDLRSYVRRSDEAKRSLEARLGHSVTDEEVAVELGMPLEVHQSQLARAVVGSTARLDASEDGPGAQMVVAEPPLADEQLDREESRRAARSAIEELPPRLRRVIELHYGDELTLRDIGAILGVTESRVCQLRSEAVRRMRERCGSDRVKSTSADKGRYEEQSHREVESFSA